jgi:hypothetical protein
MDNTKMDYKPIILEALETLRKEADTTKDSLKANAYKTAIDQFIKLPIIKSITDVKRVEGIADIVYTTLEKIFAEEEEDYDTWYRNQLPLGTRRYLVVSSNNIE